MTTYTIQKGDTLGTIATKFLGDKSKYKEILSANPQIKDANKIYPGQKINIPTTKAPSSSQIVQNLPTTVTNHQPASPEGSFLDKLKTAFQDKRVVFGLIGIMGVFAFLKYKKKI